MNSRLAALAFGVLAIALTVVQDVLPARDWYHSWQYAVILTVVIGVVVTSAWPAARGADGVVGRRLALALAGACAVAVAGLLSGLIGPDTVTVIGAPGTIVPVPEIGVAAFFSGVDPAALERGDSGVVLRARATAPIEVGTRPVPIGLDVAYTENHPAAYVEARDGAGRRLTVTQPDNASFLSPVLLFRQQQSIGGKRLPLDTFAVPSAARIVHVLYFSAADLAALHPDASGVTQPTVVLQMSAEDGKQVGLAMTTSGHPVALGGVRLAITLGSYPLLRVSSAPEPFTTVGGTVLFVAAALWALAGARSPKATRKPLAAGANATDRA